MNNTKSFFIAGVMQGNNPDASIAEQGYRMEIAKIINKHFSGAKIFDPLVEQMKRFGTRQASLLESAAKLDEVQTLHTKDFNDDLKELTLSFHEICDEAAKCDVTIAYIPKGQASMGTAVEMYSGWQTGKTIITISELKQNLTVLACSHVIIPDIHALDTLFSNGYLKE